MNNPYSATTADLSAPAGGDATYQPRVFAMNGRIGRVRYIAYSMGIMLALLAVSMVLGGVVAVAFGNSPFAFMGIAGLFYIAYIAAAFILTIRRAHDMGQSGWMSLLMLVPFVSLWFLFAPGTPTTNQYGPRPVPNTTGTIIAAFSPIVFGIVVGIVAAIAVPMYPATLMKAAAAQEQAEMSADTAPATAD